MTGSSHHGFTLIVERGSNAGLRFPLALNTYRALGRDLDREVTLKLELTGRVPLSPAQAELVKAYLKRYLSAPGRETSLPHERGEDILLDDLAISKVHGMIFCDETGVGILDLSSTNGLFVNGERVNVAMVNPGDRIRLGNTVLRLIKSLKATSGSRKQ